MNSDSLSPLAAHHGFTGGDVHFLALMQQSNVAIAEADPKGRFVRVNQRWATLLGRTETEVMELTVNEVTHPECLPATDNNYARLREGGKNFVQEKRYLRKDGSSFWATTTVSAIRDAAGTITGFIAIIVDLSDKRQGQLLVETQNDALNLVLTGSPLAKVFNRLVQAVEKDGDGVGTILLFDATTLQLRHGAAPSLPDSYNQSFNGVKIGPDSGTFAAAAFHNQIVITEDIAADPIWKNLREAPLALGLKAAFAAPIVSAAGKVLGTFGLYFRTPRQPRASEVEVISMLAKTAALAIERRRTEDSLQVATMSAVRQRRLYETVLSNTPDLVYVFNLEHRFTYANQALLNMWGKTWEESIGKTCLELGYEPWHAEMHDREIEEVIATKKPIRGDVAFHGTGGRRMYDYIFSPVIGSRGEVEAVAGTTRDVTEQRKSEATVIFLGDLAQDLAVESDETAIIRKTVTALGAHLNAHRCYFVECLETENRLTVGENWVRDTSPNLAGSYSLYDFGGPDWWKQYSAGDYFVTDTETDPLVAKAAASYRETGIRSYAVQPVKRAGPWTVVLAVTDKEPRIWTTEEMQLLDNVAARVWPLVERARSQAALRIARDDALAATRAKDDFLAALSHELRTPLNPVLLLASESAEDPSLSAEIRADFAAIARNVSLEARLIDDLLDLTRITNNKVSLQLEPQNVHELIALVVEYAKPELAEKNLRLTTDLSAAHATVVGDSVRLQQIFWNLLRNAAKFTPHGGHVTISSSVAPSSPGVLELAISDSGIGLSRDELGSIFRPFVQGEHSRSETANPYGGLGLGLAIARRLAELHGGTIRGASKGRGQGATFVVELPLSAAPGPKTPESRGESLRGSAGGRRILLIEDHEPSRLALGRLLANRGIEVFYAGSVAEGLAQAARQPIDLVVSDLGLPDGTGYDLMKELKSKYGLKGVALSGYGTEGDIQRSQDAGFLAHLTKPVQARQLDDIIAHHAVKA